eukprot:gene12038-8291_t
MRCTAHHQLPKVVSWGRSRLLSPFCVCTTFSFLIFFFIFLYATRRDTQSLLVKLLKELLDAPGVASDYSTLLTPRDWSQRLDHTAAVNHIAHLVWVCGVPVHRDYAALLSRGLRRPHQSADVRAPPPQPSYESISSAPSLSPDPVAAAAAEDQRAIAAAEAERVEARASRLLEAELAQDLLVAAYRRCQAYTSDLAAAVGSAISSCVVALSFSVDVEEGCMELRDVDALGDTVQLLALRPRTTESVGSKRKRDAAAAARELRAWRRRALAVGLQVARDAFLAWEALLGGASTPDSWPPSALTPGAALVETAILSCLPPPVDVDDASLSISSESDVVVIDDDDDECLVAGVGADPLCFLPLTLSRCNSDVVVTDASAAPPSVRPPASESAGGVGGYAPNTVFLNVYDITEANCFLVNVGLGAHHTGVEVYGAEFAFGATLEGSGVMRNTPQFCPPHVLREQLAMGLTPYTEAQVLAIVHRLTADPVWLGSAYRLLSHNCIHFAEALLTALKPARPTAGPAVRQFYTLPEGAADGPVIPAYVSRLQRFLLDYAGFAARKLDVGENTSEGLHSNAALAVEDGISFFFFVCAVMFVVLTRRMKSIINLPFFPLLFPIVYLYSQHNVRCGIKRHLSTSHTLTLPTEETKRCAPFRMPSKKGKAKQPVAPPAAATSMYEVTPGPGYKIQAHMSVLAENRKHRTYASAGLYETAGRVGHAAFLSPDQSTICVVGGLAVPLLAEEFGGGVWAFSDSSEDGDGSIPIPTAPMLDEMPITTSAVPAAADSAVPAAASAGRQPKQSADAGLPPTGRKGKSDASKAAATDPAGPPGARRSAKNVAGEAAALSGGRGAKSDGGGGEKSGPTSARGPKLDANTNGPGDTAAPTSARQRSGKESSRPATSGSTEAVAEAAAAEQDEVNPMPSPRSPTLAIPPEYKTSMPLVECFRLASNTWFVPVGEQKRAAACGGVINWPTQSGALVAWTSSRMEDIPPATSPRGKWEGPATVWVAGGWDGRRRLSTIFDYNVSNVAASDDPTFSNELIRTSIPQITDIPQLSPFSHASATLVKDRWFIFGGNGINGCTDDLYLIESSRLRDAADLRAGDFIGTADTAATPMSASWTKARHTNTPNLFGSPNLRSIHALWDCRPVSGAAYTSMVAAAPSSSLLRDSDVTPSDHADVSATFSATSRATPSQMTLGPSALGGALNSAPTVVITHTLPGPAPRSSHSAVAFQNRFLVLFGGRQLVLPHAEQAGRGRQKSASSKRAPARKGTKEKEGKGSKGSKAPPPPVDEDEDMLPSVKVLNDLAVYDTELKGWVQVRVVGSDSPVGRYGAAMALVPPAAPANVSSTHVFESAQESSVGSLSFQPASHRREANAGSTGAKESREMVLHGGFSESGDILNDLWVLQAIGKGQGGAVIEVDASGTPTLPVRWIRVMPESGIESASNSAVGSGAHASRNPSPLLPAAETPSVSPPIATPEPVVQDYPARAQHTLTVTSAREVYIIGGVQPFASRLPALSPSSQTPHSAAPLHPCVTSDHTDVVRVSLPALDAVVERESESESEVGEPFGGWLGKGAPLAGDVQNQKQRVEAVEKFAHNFLLPHILVVSLSLMQLPLPRPHIILLLPFRHLQRQAGKPLMLNDAAAPAPYVVVGGMNPSLRPSSTGDAAAATGADANGEVKIHSILCNRTSSWASRIYDNIGSEPSSMQRAEATLRQALNAMPPTSGSEGVASGGEEGTEEGTERSGSGGKEAEPQPEEASTTISVPITDEQRSHISWKCGVCGYHVLAMDQNGNPLPLSRGAYGELLPIRCPQCEMEHTSWEQAVPFDKHGDHVNIRSTLSNNYVTQCRKKDLQPVPDASSSGVTSPRGSHSPSTAARELPPILANIGRVTYKDGVAVPNNHVKPRQVPEVRMAFYCTRCGRRLLRVDSEGELVAMDKDAKGEVLPIRCPGCGEVHNRWEVKPFTVGRINVKAHHDSKGTGKPCGAPGHGSCHFEQRPTAWRKPTHNNHKNAHGGLPVRMCDLAEWIVRLCSLMLANLPRVCLVSSNYNANREAHCCGAVSFPLSFIACGPRRETDSPQNYLLSISIYILVDPTSFFVISTRHRGDAATYSSLLWCTSPSFYPLLGRMLRETYSPEAPRQTRLGELFCTVAPGIAQGATTVVLGHPLDTAKTRMQAVGPHAQPSVFQTVILIARHERVRGLYRGAGPPIVMEGAKRGVQFALWDLFRRHSAAHTDAERQSSSSGSQTSFAQGVLGFIGSSTFLSGAVAGGLGTLIGCPMHVIKIQTQYQTCGGTRNAWTCTNDIWRRDGFLGFYRGLGANMLKDVCFAGSYLSMYAHLKTVFHVWLCEPCNTDAAAAAGPTQRHASPTPHPYEPLETFLAGSMACMLTWVLLYPLDTIKTLVQSRRVTSITAVKASNLHFKEAYRGLTASLWRAGPIAGAAMICFISVFSSEFVGVSSRIAIHAAVLPMSLERDGARALCAKLLIVAHHSIFCRLNFHTLFLRCVAWHAALRPVLILHCHLLLRPCSFVCCSFWLLIYLYQDIVRGGRHSACGRSYFRARLLSNALLLYFLYALIPYWNPGSRSTMPSHVEEMRLCRMTPSSWKSGLSTPTYYVSQKRHKGFFRRIQEAVDEVPPNSRIEIVGGGTFMEKVVINKPLELCVSKNNDNPVVMFRSTVFTLQSDEVLLDGIIVQAESTMPSLIISSGRPLLKHCEIKGMEVSGSACPTIEECRFGDAKGHSIHIKQRAGGTYFRNVINGSGGYSVLIESVGDILFSYNTIAGSHLGQVSIRPSEEGMVRPRFTLNRITDDLDEAQAHLQSHVGGDAGNADISGGGGGDGGGQTMNIFKLVELPVKQTGMKVQLMPSNRSKICLNLEDDDVIDPALHEDSNYAGISAQGKGVLPYFMRNTIATCKLHGLVIKNGAGGTYEANYFTGNKGWAVFLEDTYTTDTPYFTHNHIAANGGGVKIVGCPATFEGYNVIFGNKGPQFFLDGGHEKIVLEHNMFRNCSRTAIWCVGAGGAEIARNDFESCGIAVRLERLADPRIVQNTFDSCTVGVLATNGSRGQFTDCIFSDISRVGALIQHSAHPSFTRCSFYSCSLGLQITKFGGGFFEGCTVQDCLKTSVEITDGGAPRLSNCVIRDGGQVGVLCARHAGGAFHRCQILRHAGSAVSICDGSDPVMETNLIGLSEGDGVVISCGGCGLFLRNIIYECGASGVVVTGPGSGPVLRHNYILDCGRQGLLMFDTQGTAVCEKNIFLGSHRCHVLLSVNEQQVVASLSSGKAGRHFLQAIGKLKPATNDSFLRTHTGTFNSTSGKTGTGTVPGMASSGRPRHMLIRDNIMWKSVWAGVIVDGSISAVLRGNTISGCRHGVLVYGEGHVTLLQNALEGLESGIGLCQESSADVVANLFQNISPGAAISAMNVYRSTLAFNMITQCDTGIYLRSAVGDVLVFCNLVRLAKRFGLYQHPDVVKSSRVYHNTSVVSFETLYSTQFTHHKNNEHIFFVFRVGAFQMASQSAVYRVQVVIKGQRYEMSMEVAVATCGLFRCFFTTKWSWDALGQLNAGEEESKQTPTPSGADNAQSLLGRMESGFVPPPSSWLVAYYHTAVAPLVRAELLECTPTCLQRRIWDEIGLRVAGTGSMDMIPLSPWMTPQEIVLDQERHTWVFRFGHRLTIAALQEAVVKQLALCEGKPQPAWVTHTFSTYPYLKPDAPPDAQGGLSVEEVYRRINEDPQLLLQSEFVGGIFVFLRRLSAFLPRIGTDDAGPAPSFPLRWAELTESQRTAVRAFLQVLGISFLAPLCQSESPSLPARSRAQQESGSEDDQFPPLPLACGVCGTLGHTAAMCPFAEALRETKPG